MISQAESEQEDLTQRKATDQQTMGQASGSLADAEASQKEMQTYLQEVSKWPGCLFVLRKIGSKMKQPLKNLSSFFLQIDVVKDLGRGNLRFYLVF